MAELFYGGILIFVKLMLATLGKYYHQLWWHTMLFVVILGDINFVFENVLKKTSQLTVKKKLPNPNWTGTKRVLNVVVN